MNFVIDLVKDWMTTNPARLVAYASTAAVAGALKLAEVLGVTLTAEILAGVAGLTALIVTELIRRFVYSPDTTQALVNRADATGNTDIGSPPEGK